jgi:hypothetical integral membrane protein (TIGR02206 family)
VTNPNVVIFEIFSPIWWISNIAVLIVISFLSFLPYFSKLGKKNVYPKILGTLLFLNLVLESINGALEGTWSLQEYLPFHLCSIASVFSVILLFNYNQKLAQIFYYWGLTGALNAMLSPVFLFGIEGYHYYAFYIAHGGILFVCMFMILHHNFRPEKKMWWKTFIYIQFAALGVGLINKLLGANYMFLSASPEVENVFLKYPWPWYIISFEVLACLNFWLLYVAFKYSAKPVSSSIRKIRQFLPDRV